MAGLRYELLTGKEYDRRLLKEQHEKQGFEFVVLDHVKSDRLGFQFVDYWYNDLGPWVQMQFMVDRMNAGDWVYTNTLNGWLKVNGNG